MPFKLVRRLTALGITAAAIPVAHYFDVRPFPLVGVSTLYDQSADVIRKLVPPEEAHKLAVAGLAMSRFAREYVGVVDRSEDPENLETEVWGLHFPNPLGMAAGFDKHCEAIDGIADVGFGFVECGSVTPEPQPGNPQPRVFRLEEDKSIINRYGFNSHGSKAAAASLKARASSPSDGSKVVPVGINLGMNKTSTDPVNDYVTGVQRLGRYGDYLVVNVSSPNTAGLRSLQAKEQLFNLLSEVRDARDDCDIDFPIGEGRRRGKRPLLVKISPDLSLSELADIAEVALRVKIDGIIVSNTTTSRPSSLKSEQASESGGLSGEAIKELSTQVLADTYRLTGGKIPLIGVGGVSSGEDALRKIKSGASLVQMYSSFVYGGPALVHRIKQDLSYLLDKEGCRSVKDCVGKDITLDMEEAVPAARPKPRRQQSKSQPKSRASREFAEDDRRERRNDSDDSPSSSSSSRRAGQVRERNVDREERARDEQ